MNKSTNRKISIYCDYKDQNEFLPTQFNIITSHCDGKHIKMMDKIFCPDYFQKNNICRNNCIRGENYKYNFFQNSTTFLLACNGGSGDSFFKEGSLLEFVIKNQYEVVICTTSYFILIDIELLIQDLLIEGLCVTNIADILNTIYKQNFNSRPFIHLNYKQIKSEKYYSEFFIYEKFKTRIEYIYLVPDSKFSYIFITNTKIFTNINIQTLESISIKELSLFIKEYDIIYEYLEQCTDESFVTVKKLIHKLRNISIKAKLNRYMTIGSYKNICDNLILIKNIIFEFEKKNNLLNQMYTITPISTWICPLCQGNGNIFEDQFNKLISHSCNTCGRIKQSMKFKINLTFKYADSILFIKSSKKIINYDIQCMNRNTKGDLITKIDKTDYTIHIHYCNITSYNNHTTKILIQSHSGIQVKYNLKHDFTSEYSFTL